jgi:ElaB/YqjD/DUF883 family membrane-anchored ribosome-binding protein
MASSEQLEREAEATRARIAETLAELRTRITPGQIVDEAFDYARGSNGGDWVRNLGRQLADNPLPAALMGAGLAWMMTAQRRAGETQTAETGDGSVDTTESANINDRTTAMASSHFDKTTKRTTKHKTKSATDAASDAHKTYSEVGADKTGASDALSVPAKAAELAGNAYERASDAVERAKETTTEAYDRARDVARRSVSSAVDGTRGLTRFMREEPMVLAGLGIALGALVGALLPATEIENRTMGEASDALKRDAKEAAREQWERGKDLAEEGWDEAKEAVHRTWDDAKDEAQKSWDDVKKDAGVDAHAGDTTSLQAPLVPSETKAERLADTTKPGLRSGS